jgi:hypothetical protein
VFYGEIEGSAFEVIRPEFSGCFVGHTRLERLHTGCRWAEGQLGSALAATCCGRTNRTTASFVSTIPRDIDLES